MSDAFDLRARFSFPGLSLGLDATAKAMMAWARVAASALAPELTWSTANEEQEDLGAGERWGASTSLELIGRDRAGASTGRARVRLTAGGDATTAAGSSLVEIETVRPARYLEVDNHCDVAHWDVSALSITDAQLDALRQALERVLGQQAEVGGERREPVVVAAQLLASNAAPDDASLWIEDLCSVGVESRGHAGPDGVSVFLERASFADLDALERARIALGEALAEAGREDWDTGARALLVRLPDQGSR